MALVAEPSMMYERDDLCGVWRAKPFGARLCTAREDDVTHWLDDRLVPVLRMELMSRYEGGLIRSVTLTAVTDQDGRLVPCLAGEMRVTPVGSAVRDVVISGEAWWDGSAHASSKVTGVPLGSARRRRLRRYMVGWTPVVDDLSDND